MLRSLRIASEATLGAPLPATVVFTAPYVRAWQREETLLDGLLQRARILAGLKPVTIENMDPVYLGETNTVLAANGRRICPKLRSLSNRLGTINSELGLYQQEHANDEDIFWRKLEDYLVSQAEEYVTSGDFNGDFPLGKHCIVLVAGEAADNPKFMDAISQAVTRIQNDPVHRYKDAMTGPKVKLLVSQDLTYAAAAGVALWRRSMIDSSYCENVARMDKKDRDEL
ncbi:hypothetical protein THAR02_07032 [Trichoderma harzianum]|uniref:Uncharacterized protein n=1 Tax=Trichoderma harzianum TaxID=5544 RepID=A0A0G0A6R2_TRIHA|nr:hypothetical protein THAR02_07032 [Trichoderma harzianum]